MTARNDAPIHKSVQKWTPSELHRSPVGRKRTRLARGLRFRDVVYAGTKPDRIRIPHHRNRVVNPDTAGGAIRAERLRRGLTLQQVAGAVAIPRTTLGSIERNELALNAAAAAALAEALDLPALLDIDTRAPRRRPQTRTAVGDPEPVDLPPRPQTRADCMDGERPCPWVGCRWHLWLISAGERTIRHQRRAVEDLPASCTLDVADDGPHTLDEIGQALGLTRERVRQIEAVALPKVRRGLERLGVT